jgi:hypothetical protein
MEKHEKYESSPDLEIHNKNDGKFLKIFLNGRKFEASNWLFRIQIFILRFK